MLCEVDCFKTLLKHTRVPKQFKKKVRKSKLTTFIYPNTTSFRVVDKNHKHYEFIRKFKTMYSTSANLTKKQFEKDWAIEKADIIVEDQDGFSENNHQRYIKLQTIELKK